MSDTTAEELEKIKEELHGIVFDCERLSIYHSIRRNWFESIHRWLMFLVVLSGTSAYAITVSTLAANSEFFREYGDLLILVSAAIALVDLTFNISGRAREHALLYQRFCVLRGELLHKPPTDELLQYATASVHAIYSDEPPTLGALDAWSHNVACRGRGKDDYKLVIPAHHVLLRNWLPFVGSDYKPVSSDK